MSRYRYSWTQGATYKTGSCAEGSISPGWKCDRSLAATGSASACAAHSSGLPAPAPPDDEAAAPSVSCPVAAFAPSPCDPAAHDVLASAVHDEEQPFGYRVARAVHVRGHPPTSSPSSPGPDNSAQNAGRFSTAICSTRTPAYTSAGALGGPG